MLEIRRECSHIVLVTIQEMTHLGYEPTIINGVLTRIALSPKSYTIH